MRYFYKHIAVLAFVIFTFPITYQPAHVLMHYLHMAHHNHESKTVHNKLDYQGETLSSFEKTCPVCDYQFPIKNFNKKANCRNNKPIFNEFICELEFKIPYKQVNSIKTPRAPPAVIS